MGRICLAVLISLFPSRSSVVLSTPQFRSMYQKYIPHLVYMCCARRCAVRQPPLSLLVFYYCAEPSGALFLIALEIMRTFSLKQQAAQFLKSRCFAQTLAPKKTQSKAFGSHLLWFREVRRLQICSIPRIKPYLLGFSDVRAIGALVYEPRRSLPTLEADFAIGALQQIKLLIVIRTANLSKYRSIATMP